MISAHLRTKTSNAAFAETKSANHAQNTVESPTLTLRAHIKAGNKCLLCKHMIGPTRSFGFNKCAITQRNVKTYNICEKFAPKNATAPAK